MNTKRTGIVVALAVCILLAVTAIAAQTVNAAEAAKITILHANDPHAHYIPYAERGFEGLIGGFARMRTLMAEAQTEAARENRTVFAFLAGDLLMGTPFSTMFKGREGVALMNDMGFTAMAVGNHEFDYGQANLTEIRQLMTFPLLSANVRTEAGNLVFDELIERPLAGIGGRVLIFGLTTAETPITTYPDNVKGLVFKDPIETAKLLVAKAAPGDLVIAVTHLGADEDMQLAEACPRINVIIGGHTHTSLFEPRKVGETLVCQAGAYAKYLGRLDFEFADGKVLNYAGKLILLDSSVKEDEKTASVIAAYKAQLDKAMSTVIGRANVLLEGSMSTVRSPTQTNLGRLMGYLAAKASGTKAAFLNGGSIRQSILEGDITPGDVYTSLPFPGNVVRMDLTGADVLAVFQRSADLEQGHGGKLQTWGVDYTVDNGKVTIRSMAGIPFDPAGIYCIATNNYLAAGGDGYAIIKEHGKNAYDTSSPVSDLLIDFVKENGVITKELLDKIGDGPKN